MQVFEVTFNRKKAKVSVRLGAKPKVPSIETGSVQCSFYCIINLGGGFLTTTTLEHICLL